MASRKRGWIWAGLMAGVALVTPASAQVTNQATQSASPAAPAMVAAKAAPKPKARPTASASATGGTAQSLSQSGATAAGGGVNVKVPHQVYAPSFGGLPSGPCTGTSTGISGGVPLVALGVQRGEIDQQCTYRQNIMLVAQFDPELARRMLGLLDGVAETRGGVVRKADATEVFAPQGANR